MMCFQDLPKELLVIITGLITKLPDLQPPKKNNFFFENEYYISMLMPLSRTDKGSRSVFLPYILNSYYELRKRRMLNPQKRINFMIYYAAIGSISLLEWTISGAWSFWWHDSCCATAALYGNLNVLVWLKKNSCPWDAKTISFAALGGHMEILEWARENVCFWNESAPNNAASVGNLEVLKWLNDNGCPFDIGNISAYAAKSGHLNVLKWLKQKRLFFDDQICTLAANYGHLNIIQWGRLNNCFWDRSTSATAAKKGNLEIFKWLIINGCPCDLIRCRAIAFDEGFVEILDWIDNYIKKQ